MLSSKSSSVRKQFKWNWNKIMLRLIVRRRESISYLDKIESYIVTREKEREGRV